MNFNEETIDVFIFPDNHHRNDESSKKRMRDHSSNQQQHQIKTIKYVLKFKFFELLVGNFI